MKNKAETPLNSLEMNPSKAFRTLLLYRIGATLSYQMTMVAVGWHI